MMIRDDKYTQLARLFGAGMGVIVTSRLPADLKGNRTEDLKGNRIKDLKGNRIEDLKENRTEDLKGNRTKI